MYELFFDDETSHIVLSAIWDYAMFDLTQSWSLKGRTEIISGCSHRIWI
jgi:hypothetical protein